MISLQAITALCISFLLIVLIKDVTSNTSVISQEITSTLNKKFWNQFRANLANRLILATTIKPDHAYNQVFNHFPKENGNCWCNLDKTSAIKGTPQDYYDEACSHYHKCIYCGECQDNIFERILDQGIDQEFSINVTFSGVFSFTATTQNDDYSDLFNYVSTTSMQFYEWRCSENNDFVSMAVCLCFENFEKEFFKVMLYDITNSIQPEVKIDWTYNNYCLREDAPKNNTGITGGKDVTSLSSSESISLVLNLDPEITHCCGSSALNWFIYTSHNGDKACCGSDTYQTDTHECCSDETIQLIGNCAVWDPISKQWIIPSLHSSLLDQETTTQEALSAHVLDVEVDVQAVAASNNYDFISDYYFNDGSSYDRPIYINNLDYNNLGLDNSFDIDTNREVPVCVEWASGMHEGNVVTTCKEWGSGNSNSEEKTTEYETTKSEKTTAFVTTNQEETTSIVTTAQEVTTPVVITNPEKITQSITTNPEETTPEVTTYYENTTDEITAYSEETTHEVTTYFEETTSDLTTNEVITTANITFDPILDKVIEVNGISFRLANIAKVLWQFLAHFQKIEEILAHF